MGKAKDPIFGGFSGRMGNVVGCLRHGKYYLRTLPEKVNQPDTPKQMAQRLRFRLVLDYLTPFSGFLKIGFGGYATGKSAYNAAMSYNLKHALTGAYPELAVDPGKILLCHGLLPQVAEQSLTAEAGKLVFRWQPTPDSNPNDSVILLTFCPDLKVANWIMHPAKRGDGTVEIEIPAGWDDKPVRGYLSFYDLRLLSSAIKPEYISDSVFAGEVVL